MSIFQKTFVFLHHLCTSGAKSAKNSSVQEPCKIKNKKQDEDITYFTTRQNEVAPLGTAAVAQASPAVASASDFDGFEEVSDGDDKLPF